MAKVFNRDVELAGDARLVKDGTVLIDADGNIDAPATVSSLTVSGASALNGAVTLGDASGDAITLTGTMTAATALQLTAGYISSASSRQPAADDGPNTIINAGVLSVDVVAPANDANDWITLPALSATPEGHTIKICCNGGSNFELRTPASSNEKINGVDADGTNEYLCTDTDLIFVTKVSDTAGWYAYDLQSSGAIRTAHVPN